MFEGFIDKLSDPHLEGLRRETELGELNFASTVEKLRTIRVTLEALEQESANDLPAQRKEGALGYEGQIDQVLEEMRTFTLAQDQAQTQRTNIENRVEGVREWFVANIRPFLRAKDVDAAAASTTLVDARHAADEIRQLLDRLRVQAGEVGAGKLSARYEGQATGHSSRAAAFLSATAIALALIAVLGIYLFVWNPLPTKTTASDHWEEFARGLVIRAFFLGLAAWVLAFLSRSYRVEKHLQVVNEQKQNALDTYALFTEAAAVPELQGIVTAELARTIFSLTETGYLTDEQVKTVIENQPSLLSALRPSS
jgi:hypothetical protein